MICLDGLPSKGLFSSWVLFMALESVSDTLISVPWAVKHREPSESLYSSRKSCRIGVASMSS